MHNFNITPMSSEERAIADALDASLVARIDSLIIAQASTRFKKVARVVGEAMCDETLNIPGLTDAYFSERVRLLVEKGLLVGFGDLNYLGYSSVRLPSQP